MRDDFEMFCEDEGCGDDCPCEFQEGSRRRKPAHQVQGGGCLTMILGVIGLGSAMSAAFISML